MTEPFKRIELTRGKFARVSPEDFGWLNSFKWCALNNGSYFCAVRNTPSVDGVQRTEYMNRTIMDAAADERINHINGNKLDNRRSNLRIATRSESHINRGMHMNNTSGYKGVFKKGNRWCAQVGCDSVSLYLGTFDSRKEAAKAYDRKAYELFGEVAKLNFGPTERRSNVPACNS